MVLVELVMLSFIKSAALAATVLTSAVAVADTQPTAEVFFAFDSSLMSTATSSSLAAMATWSKQHPFSKIIIDGHTDSSGSDAYNIGLSSRRSESVQARLIALGVPVARTYRGLFGENDVRRSTFAGDRRVTVWATTLPLYLLADDMFGRTAIMWSSPATAADIDGPIARK